MATPTQAELSAMSSAVEAAMQGRSTQGTKPLYSRGGCCGESWDRWMMLALTSLIILVICALISAAAAAGSRKDAPSSDSASSRIAS